MAGWLADGRRFCEFAVQEGVCYMSSIMGAAMVDTGRSISGGISDSMMFLSNL